MAQGEHQCSLHAGCMRTVSEARARLETHVPVHVSHIHRVCVTPALDSCAHRAITARIYVSKFAAACSMAPRVRAVHVLCASSGADARTRSGKVATVLAVHGAAVDDGVTEVSQGSWSVAVAVLI